MNETFDDMAKEVMRKIQRSDRHAFMVIRAALRKSYTEGEKDAQQSVQRTACADDESMVLQIINEEMAEATA